MKKKTWNKNKKKKTMLNSYEIVQTRKLISSYGGAGSIIETRDGAIIVEPFSEWSFFKDYKLYHDKRNWINDKRFIYRLKTWFEKLEALVEIPENDLQENGYPEKSAETISAKYFPEWMFCPKCKQFDKLENNKKFNPDKINFYSVKNSNKICELNISDFNTENCKYTTLKRSSLIDFLKKDIEKEIKDRKSVV